MKVITKYNNAVDRNPIITKCLSAAAVFAIGDYLCQEMENRVLKLKDRINWTRVVKQGSFGLVVAPYIHFQFCKVIPYLFPDNKKYSFFFSVLYAATVSDGIFNYAFFIYMHYANTKKNTGKEPKVMDSIKAREVFDKWVPVQINNVKVWPFMTGFNFYFMPIQLRVLVDNVFCIFWNIYLSYVENNPKKKHEESGEFNGSEIDSRNLISIDNNNVIKKVQETKINERI